MQKERKRKRDVPIILSSLLSRQKPRMPLPSQISFFAAVLLTSCIDFVGTPLHSRHMPDTPINYNSDSDQPFSASTLQLSFPDDDLSEPKPYRLILYSYDILIISETFQQSRSQRARPRGPETSEKNKRTLPNSVSGHRTLSFLPITQSMSRLAPIPCTSKATSLLLYSTLNVLACTQMREREKQATSVIIIHHSQSQATQASHLLPLMHALRPMSIRVSTSFHHPKSRTQYSHLPSRDIPLSSPGIQSSIPQCLLVATLTQCQR